MMSLVELPPEAFQGFIYALVQQAGAAGAWKLRGVSRLFASEIEFNIFAKQAHGIFDQKYPASRRLLAKKAWLYLFYRSKVLLDFNPALPDKVNEIMQWLNGEFEIGSQNLDLQDELRERVCKFTTEGLPDTRTYFTLFDFSGPQRFPAMHDELARELSSSDKLAVAAGVGDVKLLRRLLPSATLTLSSGVSRGFVFGSVLTKASICHKVDVLNTIFSYMDQSLRPPNYKALQSFFDDHDFENALIIAMECNDVTIAHELLGFYQSHLQNWTKDEYNEWLLCAVTSGHVEMVRQVMGIEIERRHKVVHTTFDEACEQGDPDIVTALIFDHRGGIQGMPINYVWRNWSPLVAAVKLGTLDIVKTVLDAGAKVNKLNKTGNRLEVVELAMKRGDRSIIQALLDGGAKLRYVEIKTRRKDVYNLLREAKTKQGYPVPTYQERYARKKRQA